MNAMTMPGFTADTSLYKTSGQYQSVTPCVDSRRGQRVISQIRVGAGGVGGIGGVRLDYNLVCTLICAVCDSFCHNPATQEQCNDCNVACEACWFPRL